MLATMSRSQPVWPDSAKFHQFGKDIIFFGSFWRVFSEILYLIWQKNYAIGLIFIVVNDQNIENIVASGHTVRDCI